MKIYYSGGEVPNMPRYHAPYINNMKKQGVEVVTNMPDELSTADGVIAHLTFNNDAVLEILRRAREMKEFEKKILILRSKSSSTGFPEDLYGLSALREDGVEASNKVTAFSAIKTFMRSRLGYSAGNGLDRLNVPITREPDAQDLDPNGEAFAELIASDQSDVQLELPSL